MTESTEGLQGEYHVNLWEAGVAYIKVMAGCTDSSLALSMAAFGSINGCILNKFGSYSLNALYGVQSNSFVLAYSW